MKGIENLQSLRELHLHSNNISKIESLQGLQNLEVRHFENQGSA